MKHVKGDLIQLAIQGDFDVIVHGCNCFNTMGSGIAKTIKEKFPPAYRADLNTVKGNPDKLGRISSTTIYDLTVLNAYIQFRYGTDEVHVDYDAVRAVFKTIAILYPKSRIGYPMIGCGLAGGDWDIVSKIIDDELEGCDHTIVIFEKL